MTPFAVTTACLVLALGSVVAAEVTPESLLSLEKLGLMGVLALAIVGFIRRWVVPGVYYDDLKKDNDALRLENDRLRGELRDTRALVGRAVGTAETVAQKMPTP